MDRRDRELIERLLPESAELRELWREHQRLEAELEQLRQQRFLTPAEQVRQRELQKAKLAGKDRIQILLRRYR